MDKKNNTKVFLAESLRTLMQKMPFQSITIKKICDEAGVVRVTFYNYFVDKYDALDALVRSDFEQGLDLTSQDPLRVLIEHLGYVLETHRKFYEIAIEIDGQNGFQEIFIQCVKEKLCAILNAKRAESAGELKNEFLAETYAVMMFYFARVWLRNPKMKEEQFVQDAMKMCQSSFYDFMS